MTGSGTTSPPSAGAAEGSILEDRRQAEFISVDEWAKRVGLSGRSAYRAVKNNEVPGVYKTGRRIIINWSAFVASTYDAA